MTDISIRWCQPEDWQELGRIHCESYQSTYRGIIPEGYLKNITYKSRQEFYRNIISQESMNTAILLEEGKALGLLRIEELKEEIFEIKELYLIEGSWGKGYGKAFLLWLEEELKVRKSKKIVLWVLQENEKARKFYERYGFERTGEVRIIERGKELKQNQYIKKIMKE